jgi:hypothetical protein
VARSLGWFHVLPATDLIAAAAAADADTEVAAAQAKLDEDGSGGTVAEDVRALALATHSCAAAKEALRGERASALDSLVARRIGVKPEAQRFVQGLLYFLGHKKEAQGDPRSPDPLSFQWLNARSLLAPATLLPLLDAFNPELPHGGAGASKTLRSLAYLTPAAIRDHIAGITTDELDRVSSALGALHVWLTAAINAQVRRAAVCGASPKRAA